MVTVNNSKAVKKCIKQDKHQSNSIIKTFQTDENMCRKFQERGFAFSPGETTAQKRSCYSSREQEELGVPGTGDPACSTCLNTECSVLEGGRGVLFLLKEASRESESRSCPAAEQLTVRSNEELTSGFGCGPQHCDNSFLANS